MRLKKDREGICQQDRQTRLLRAWSFWSLANRDENEMRQGVAIRIGSGAGFLGDNLDAPKRLVETVQLDFLTLEYLAELTLSILARVREKNPQAGYAGDFVEVLRSLVPALHEQPELKIITNAGGMNPVACARAISAILSEAGLGDLPIGIVTGDDILAEIPRLQAEGCHLANMETGVPLDTQKLSFVSANAYLGAQPIVEALQGGARIVITGRVADAALTVAPAVYALNWGWDDWDRLAAASVAGHVIECGAQSTGGLYRQWEDLNLADVGYPVAELYADGKVVITKPPASGGRVNRETVIGQLLYEIGDPAHYLTPDVDVDFTTLEVRDIEADFVAIENASGRAAPECYKVSAAYRNGFTASGQLLVCGRDAASKAQACGEMIFARLAAAGYEYEDSLIECLGTGASAPGFQPTGEVREVMLRVSVRDLRRDAVERFTKEIAPLITSGPPGLAGYASGRSAVRPVFAYWPTLVPKTLITPRVEVHAAMHWKLQQ